MESLYQKYLECTGVSTDTRQITKDVMFFALKGGNFNGNQFASEALEKGAKYVVIDEAEFKKDDRYLLVEDGLTALQKLANEHRRKLNIPFLAITGSNGKTTTKELIAAVLRCKYKTFATRGNLNNHIGIPLTILAIPKETQMAVIEMGANHQKEIESYCVIAEPTHGVITNVGKAHLEGFGGFEGVKKGKGELYEYLASHNGIVFLNSSNEHLTQMARRVSKKILYSQPGDFFNADLLAYDPVIRFKTDREYTTQLPGRYNFENICAALCIGKYFEVDMKAACEAVAAYDPQNNRSQIVRKGSNQIIMDAYNANPSSMKAALENFSLMKAPNKWVILGDMFELGEESIQEHEAIGTMLNDLGFDKVILCGKHMKVAAEKDKAAVYKEDKAALTSWLKENHPENAFLLIKGSRGMGLETLLEIL